MAGYQRLLSYLYAYQKEDKQSCVGFIKVEIKSDGLKLSVMADDARWDSGIALNIIIYKWSGDDMITQILGPVEMTQDREEMILYLREEKYQSFDIDYWAGIVLYDDNRILYGSIWEGDNLPVEKILESLHKKEPPKQVTDKTEIKQENDNLKQKESAKLDQKKTRQETVQSVQSETEQETEELIHPQIAGGRKIRIEQLREILGEENKLYRNGFIRRGMEKYNYLITGSILIDGKERLCIGVPGIFNSKEQYLAKNYDFKYFLPLQENGIKTGKMGYWIYLADE